MILSEHPGTEEHSDISFLHLRMEVSKSISQSGAKLLLVTSSPQDSTGCTVKGLPGRGHQLDMFPGDSGAN